MRRLDINNCSWDPLTWTTDNIGLWDTWCFAGTLVWFTVWSIIYLMLNNCINQLLFTHFAVVTNIMVPYKQFKIRNCHLMELFTRIAFHYYMLDFIPSCRIVWFTNIGKTKGFFEEDPFIASSLVFDTRKLSLCASLVVNPIVWIRNVGCVMKGRWERGYWMK